MGKVFVPKVFHSGYEERLFIPEAPKTPGSTCSNNHVPEWSNALVKKKKFKKFLLGDQIKH